jgi:hypothetical protein
MKNSYIPVNNSIDKALAFAPTLSEAFRKTNQRITTKPKYIETIDTIKNLMKQGWNIDGVCENRNKSSFKIDSHYIKMSHPDLTMKTTSGKEEGIANLYIGNSCNGTKAMNIDFGMYRQVCSNGLIRFDGEQIGSIPHNNKGIERYPIIMNKVNEYAADAMDSFAQFKSKELTISQIQKLTHEAMKLRFVGRSDISPNQLLTVRRPEDEGDNLWSVYNRIQENLTQSGMIVDTSGKLISGVTSVQQDMEINKSLFNLVQAYA